MTRNCKNLEPRRRRAVLVSGKGGWRSAGRLRTGPPPGRLRLARCLPTGPGEPSGFQVARLGAGGLEGEATGPAASSPRSLERHPGEPQAGIRGPWGVGQGAAGCGRCGVTSGLSCRCQWQAGLRGPRPLEARGSDTGNLTQTEARAPRAGPLLGSDQGASALMAYQASLSHACAVGPRLAGPRRTLTGIFGRRADRGARRATSRLSDLEAHSNPGAPGRF